MKNTKQQGLLRFFIYFDKKDNEYVGFCIDLGIIKCCSNPYHIERDLVEAAQGYVETVCEQKLPDNLLNQSPPREYLDIFESFVRTITCKQTVQDSSINFDEARTFSKSVPELCPAM